MDPKQNIDDRLTTNIEWLLANKGAPEAVVHPKEVDTLVLLALTSRVNRNLLEKIAEQLEVYKKEIRELRIQLKAKV